MGPHTLRSTWCPTSSQPLLALPQAILSKGFEEKVSILLGVQKPPVSGKDTFSLHTEGSWKVRQDEEEGGEKKGLRTDRARPYHPAACWNRGSVRSAQTTLGAYTGWLSGVWQDWCLPLLFLSLRARNDVRLETCCPSML